MVKSTKGNSPEEDTMSQSVIYAANIRGFGDEHFQTREEAEAWLREQGYVDTGVKILIAVVIGALLLAGLYALFNTTIMPTVKQKVEGLFNYNG